jgi:hypothetical protein
MRNLAVIVVIAGTLGATALACREVAPEVTAVRIVVIAPLKPFNQLEFSLQDINARSLLQTTRPPDGGVALRGQQDFVVYLDDPKTSTDVACGARALQDTTTVASGSNTVTLVLHAVVNCAVHLEAVDGGADVDIFPGGDAAPDGGVPEVAPETSPDRAPDTPPEAPPDLPSEQTSDGSLLDLKLPDLL